MILSCKAFCVPFQSAWTPKGISKIPIFKSMSHKIGGFCLLGLTGYHDHGEIAPDSKAAEKKCTFSWLVQTCSSPELRQALCQVPV